MSKDLKFPPEKTKRETATRNRHCVKSIACLRERGTLAGKVDRRFNIKNDGALAHTTTRLDI